MGCDRLRLGDPDTFLVPSFGLGTHLLEELPPRQGID
jgi:hypothetical protein